MDNIKRSFSSFYPFLKFYCFIKVESFQSGIVLRAFGLLHLTTVISGVLFISYNHMRDICDILQSFSEQKIILLMFIVRFDASAYNILIAIFYTNCFRRRKYFASILKLFEAFDQISESTYQISFNYKKLKKDSWKLLGIIIVFFIYLIPIYLLEFDNLYKFCCRLIAFILYFIYVLQLTFFIFILQNICIRLETINGKIFKISNGRKLENIELIFNILLKIIEEFNNGFWIDFFIIFGKYRL